MLDPTGQINKFYYLIGIILLTVLIGLSSSLMMTFFIVNFAAGELGAEKLAEIAVLRNLLSGFLPTLIPLQFLMLWCSITLTKKRVKALEFNKVALFVCILINFMFFNILANGVTVFSYMQGAFAHSYSRYLIEPESVKWFVSTFMVLGLLVNGYFLVAQASQEDRLANKPLKSTNGFNQYDFSLYIGKLILVNFIIMLTLAVLAYFALKDLAYIIRSDWFLIAAITYQLIVLGFYLYGVHQRVKDSGFSSLYWIVAVLFVIALFASAVYLIQLNNDYSLYVLALLPFMVSISGLLHLLPFIFKSQEKTTIKIS